MGQDNACGDEVICLSQQDASVAEGAYETIRELLGSGNVAGVVIEMRGKMYHVESKTREEYSRIMRAYIAAFPGSLSKGLGRKQDDLRQIKTWLSEGYTLLLADRGDFVRAYRYVPV